MFSYRTNSLLAAALAPDRSTDTYRNASLPHWPSRNSLNSLSTISALYLYTNPPPVGYGTPAPKVAESVLRSYNYNRNPPELRMRRIDLWDVNIPYWLGEDSAYPFDQVHGNFRVREAYDMFESLLIKNFENIQIVADRVTNHFLLTNSTVLTKGRQTWCPIQEQSLPSALAYRNMAELFEMNLGVKSTNCFEWLRCFFRMLERTEITYNGFVLKEQITYNTDKVTREKTKRIKTIRQLKTKTIKGKEECYKFMMDLARSFCSYIKHGERGKLQRRAIASANMILRMFLMIVEEFHLQLSKLMEGSTIGIGGEEKKKRISVNLQRARLNHPSMIGSAQATEDATKWNECLSADIFALLHLTWFNHEVRRKLDKPATSNHEATLLKVCLSARFLLAIKRITLGEGPICYSEGGYFNLPKCKAGNLDRYNRETREWFSQCIPRLSGDQAVYLEAPAGMLMGMHNALSTTIGEAHVMHYQDPIQSSVTTLRSSDDSMTLFLSSTPEMLGKVIEVNRKCLKLLGINLSESKTMIFDEGYGEFTPWFQDGAFVSQYGIETSTLRPQGKNPSDDFYTVAKSTSVSQQRLEINPLGAEAKIKIGVANCRRLWRVKREPGKWEGVSDEVQLLADGGACMWTPMCCHLEETSLKEHFVRTKEDAEYLLKIRHPNNPFSSDPSEEITYSTEMGKIVTDVTEVPRTVFHFVKRTM